MPLTITVTLEDDDVRLFINRYNDDAGIDITPDMVNQNTNLHAAIAEDMVVAWFDSSQGDDNVSTYDLYSEFFEPEQQIVTLPGDPALSYSDIDEDDGEY